MSKLGTLVRTGLKSNFGMAVLYHRIVREKKDRWIIPLLGLSLLGVVPILYGIIDFVQRSYLVLRPIDQERAILNLGILSGQIIILIFGIYYVVSAFYFSRDLEMLIPLPLRPFEVMTSKFAVVMVNEYLTIAAFVLPILITYGLQDKGGAGYWFNAILIYLTLPVIPLAIISVLVVSMMRVINISRKKDFLILIGSFTLLLAVFGIQILASHADQSNMNAREIAGSLSSPDSLLNRIGSKFPPSIWATKAIDGGFSTEGLKYLAIFLASSLMFGSAMILFAEQLFYKGLIGLAEAGLRKRVLTQREMSRRISSGRRAVTAIFIREWRIMNRTPIFLLNGILVVAMVPAFLMIMAKTGQTSFGHFSQMIVASNYSLVPILFLALFMTICGCTNSTCSSTFSREGAQFWISRVIPVSPRDQVAAKFLHSYLISILGVIVAVIMAVLVLPVNELALFAAAGLALLMGILLTAVGMIIDLARPLLDWTNPQKAVKQNLNVMLAMFADIGILTATCFAIRALIKTGASAQIIISALFVVLALLAGLSYLSLLKFADKRYREIEI
jgi:ABC-2 type transport system permease protein